MMLRIRPVWLLVGICCSVAGLVFMHAAGYKSVAPSQVEFKPAASPAPSPTTVTTQNDKDLLAAVEKNDLPGVEQALSRGADPNVKDAANYAAMMIAALKGNDKVISKLLEYHAEIDAINDHGDSALALAVKSKGVNVTKLLINHGANPTLVGGGHIILNIAITNSDLETVQLLLNVQPALDLEKKDDWGNAPLLVAAAEKNMKVVEMLLEKGANANASDVTGVTPLMKGVGYTRILELLIEHGADVNARDKDNWSPLESAMSYGCRKDIELLKKAGAQP
jgi:ankyrin repeat protein